MNWTAALNQYGNLVRQVCYQYEKDPEELEDLIQEVWARAFDKFEQFNGGSDFGTWLHAVAESVSRNYVRYQEARPEIIYNTDLASVSSAVEELDEYEEASFDQTDVAPSSLGQPEEWAQAEEVAALIDEATDLTKLAWIVLHCHTMRGQSTKEISSTLGVEESTVRTYLQRVREEIDAILEENQVLSVEAKG